MDSQQKEGHCRRLADMFGMWDRTDHSTALVGIIDKVFDQIDSSTWSEDAQPLLNFDDAVCVFLASTPPSPRSRIKGYISDVCLWLKNQLLPVDLSFFFSSKSGAAAQ
eukprot:NODE_1972_length_1339_cov_40.462016_g1789_i0.p1 GENE.NODE_1972_length_1339_cov_40.462016_g1789_i0~~NODE_1972_length_1339_cov_40.462016_g1789_i0.p1  ORF type:complete len:108 (-),score=10.24 NODE_1972_length_1339_cov_40.462016_g1789_i0:558-881(-)